MSQTMSTYKVVTNCGNVKDGFESEEKAKDGADTHEALCEDCDKGSSKVVENVGREEKEEETNEASQSDQSESETTAAEVIEQEPVSEDDTPETHPEAFEEAHEQNLKKNAIDIETEEQFVKEIKGVPEPFVVNMGGSPHIRKSGYYYLASQMGLEITTQELSPTWEGNSEVSAYKGIVTDGEKSWSNVGTAHLEYEDMQDAAANLDELAATRAACRALSMATGTGVASMEEMIGENDER